MRSTLKLYLNLLLVGFALGRTYWAFRRHLAIRRGRDEDHRHSQWN